MSEPINQPPLWCRNSTCPATHEAFDDEGVCQSCETHNILREWNITIQFPVLRAYSEQEALARFIHAVGTDSRDILHHIHAERA
jgi:hypothetical protein